MNNDEALALIRVMGERLTPRQREILNVMATHRHDEHGELVYERGAGAWLADEPIAPRHVYALLRACAIRLTSRDGDSVERYEINETGLALIGPVVT